ncbi:hypothetical protein GO684_04595 [Wolbachia endosymbiont of Litomosoides brasiliensis]|nr:hypothetical protein [Wolbachia endosymbiont of Litomosoides brasiliensis]NUY39878.1 hypothetical protein [Wolbachia endosymbiont of Litomosoides brasiliensis]
MLQKTKCYNYNKKAQYNSRSKNILHFKNSTNCMDKAPKFGREEKLFTPP